MGWGCALVAISGDTPSAQTANSASKELVWGYRPELDAVRFFAFLLVFIHHFLSPVDFKSYDLFTAAGERALRVDSSLREACAMGLCLFFTLSAYLITSLLLRERESYGSISIRKFYLRRMLRIWPLYYLGIAIGVAMALLFRQTRDIVGFVAYLFLAGNFYCAAFGWLHNAMYPLWSISIEEQFYLLWPWAMRCFSRRGLAVSALGMIAAANITLFALGERHAVTDPHVWANTLVQFEMFSTGILLALAKKRMAWGNAWMGLGLATSGPVLWFGACFFSQVKQPEAAGVTSNGATLMIAYALIALGCAGVLQGFCMIGPSHIPQWVAALGKVSYGLYVYHVLAIAFAKACFDPSRGLAYQGASAALALGLTATAAVISYEYFESPFLRLKRRFEILHSKPI